MKNIITTVSLLLFSCSVYAQKYELNFNPVFVDGYVTYVNASVRKAVKKTCAPYGHQLPYKSPSVCTGI